MNPGIETKSTNGTPDKSGVSVSSESYNKLMSGFSQSMKRASAIGDKWREKERSSGTVFRCLGKNCRKEYKTKDGLRKHWKSRKNKCCENDGFEEVSSAKPTLEDRLTDDELAKADRASSYQDAAAAEARKILDKRKPPSTGPSNVSDLKNIPLGMLEIHLRRADPDAIREFLKMRFDSQNSVRRHLAERELERRGE